MFINFIPNCTVTPIPFVVITLAVRSEHYGVRNELTGELQLYVKQYFVTAKPNNKIKLFPKKNCQEHSRTCAYIIIRYRLLCII